MSPTRLDRAITVRALTGMYKAPCTYSLRKFASAEMNGNAYSTEALVKKPRCGSMMSSRVSQKNVGLMLEIWMFDSERSSPSTGTSDGGVVGSSSSSTLSSAQRSPSRHSEILYS